MEFAPISWWDGPTSIKTVLVEIGVSLALLAIWCAWVPVRSGIKRIVAWCAFGVAVLVLGPNHQFWRPFEIDWRWTWEATEIGQFRLLPFQSIALMSAWWFACLGIFYVGYRRARVA